MNDNTHTKLRNAIAPRPGPCITNVFATRRKNFSQWHRSFQRRLLSHWLKFLRHVAITLVIQGPVAQKTCLVMTSSRCLMGHSLFDCFTDLISAAIRDVKQTNSLYFPTVPNGAVNTNHLSTSPYPPSPCQTRRTVGSVIHHVIASWKSLRQSPSQVYQMICR